MSRVTNYAKPDADALTAAITWLARHFSIEILPHDIANMTHWRRLIPAHTPIYIASPPSCSFDDVARAAIKVQQNGGLAVPHLAVRRLASESQAREWLKALQAAGVSRILIISGDGDVPPKLYDSALAFLQTGLLEAYGFADIGLAGHPLGLPFLSRAQSWQALLDKCRRAQQSSARFNLVSQFSLDPQDIVSWECQLRQHGISLPLHAGLAGRISPAKLMHYALRCGVVSSLKSSFAGAGKIVRLSRSDALGAAVWALAQARLDCPQNLIAGLHLFPFGNFEATAHWVGKLSRGEFMLSGKSNNVILLDAPEAEQ